MQENIKKNHIRRNFNLYINVNFIFSCDCGVKVYAVKVILSKFLPEKAMQVSYKNFLSSYLWVVAHNILTFPLV